MENISFGVNKDLSNLLKKLYGSPEDGAERIVAGFLIIREQTLYELKGIFSRNELTALVEAQNGLIPDPPYQANKDMLIAHLQSYEQYGNGLSRHDVEANALNNKIEKLTCSQVYFLQDIIDTFWRNQESPDDLIKSLL